MKWKEMQKWQIKRLLLCFLPIALGGIIYLAICMNALLADRNGEDTYWNSSLTTPPEVQKQIDQVSVNATPVTVGTYVENLKEISLKGAYFRVVFLAWFKWEGTEDLNMKDHFRVYKGYMNKMEVVKDYHENGQHYQLVRCDATVTKNYWTKRFPLESHQLRFYLESQIPADQVILVADKENSGYNRSLDISGFRLQRYDTGIYNMEYASSNGDPEINGDVFTSEHVTAMEVNRSSWGLYAKCFIALVGTTLWILITLYINTYHKVDPIGMIPGALFGTVSNIMVGANLLPDALTFGLLEYVNIFGILVILSSAISIINVNRIRNKYEDRAFAAFYGKLMFYTIVVLTLVGNLVLPFSAFIR